MLILVSAAMAVTFTFWCIQDVIEGDTASAYISGAVVLANVGAIVLSL